MSVNGTAYRFPDRAGALASYPHCRRVGSTYYISGTSSRRPDNSYEGVTIREDGTFTRDIYAQTKAVIENIQVYLNKVGLGLEHLVDLTVFLVDMKDYAEFNRAYNEYFNAETGPTRTTVAVAELPSPYLNIEIKALAVFPEGL